MHPLQLACYIVSFVCELAGILAVWAFGLRVDANETPYFGGNGRYSLGLTAERGVLLLLLGLAAGMLGNILSWAG